MMSQACGKLARVSCGVRQLFNMSNAMQEAVLQLIEEQLAQGRFRLPARREMKMPSFMPAAIMRHL